VGAEVAQLGMNLNITLQVHAGLGVRVVFQLQRTLANTPFERCEVQNHCGPEPM
jgi:hypothetical protein